LYAIRAHLGALRRISSRVASRRYSRVRGLYLQGRYPRERRFGADTKISNPVGSPKTSFARVFWLGRKNTVHSFIHSFTRVGPLINTVQDGHPSPFPSLRAPEEDIHKAAPGHHVLPQSAMDSRTATCLFVCSIHQLDADDDDDDFYFVKRSASRVCLVAGPHYCGKWPPHTTVRPLYSLP
jgi:hypothetical protein